METEPLPTPPDITAEFFEQCALRKDFRPLLFEWYKYTGVVCNYFSCISLDSPAVREISPRHYSILIGLLNRCSRLMLANIALTHEGRFGETSSILDRCIAESTIKLRWLCSKNDPSYFERFIADGLKVEIELKKHIESNINENNGEMLAIEERMLTSIKNLIEDSGLSIEEVQQTKRMPDFASILNQLNLSRLTYTVLQGMGSHHVHGTWPSLMFHYIEQNEDGSYSPRDHDCEPHINQFIFLPLLVLEALHDFIDFIIAEDNEKTILFDLIDDTKEEIFKINQYVTVEDLKY